MRQNLHLPSNSLKHLASYAQTLVQDQSKIREKIVESIFNESAAICEKVVTYKDPNKLKTEKLDAIFTSPIWGFPIMLSILSVVFWITIAGANIPSSMLAEGFSWLEMQLTSLFTALNAPDWMHGIFILGLFRGTAWVVSVMLPPMAIFFPMFALLENYGYLPRVAFNLDRLFKKVGAHGKQSLTMAMGFGCNAAAVMSTRIIESPRERMLAILTNNFVPCNGRWPTLILIASLYMASSFVGGMATFITALTVICLVLFGITVTLFVSWILSKTILRGIPSHYTLELPPYRRPKIWNTVIRASLDKSFYVLKRAVMVAAPASIITWLLANIYIGDTSILMYFVNLLDPFARMLGLDGFILAAFIIGLPANEIVVPILLMGYLSQGALLEIESLAEIKQIFASQGWTWLTALNMMLFSLLHFPCGTTLVNIYQETKSMKCAFLAFLIPTSIACLVIFLTASIARLFGLV